MKRLPTKTEYEALLKLQYKWDEERNGLLVTADNGNELFFQEMGYSYGPDVYEVSNCGFYWSSTLRDKDNAWYFYFDWCETFLNDFKLSIGRTVRLISDTPCYGYIDMGTGIYWAIENYQAGDKIYFTWDEAMAIKDKVNGTAGLLIKKDGNTPELNITEILNWEQRRYEIAKAALAGLLANPSFSGTVGIAKRAVKYADDMIKQLKQHDK